MQEYNNVKVEVNGMTYHLYITGVITQPEDFMEEIHILTTAQPNDVIYIHLNTPGGSLPTTINIIQAIRDSQATVVACADGEVSSGGSLIFFSCPNMKVGDYCHFLIHDGSTGNYGKLSENIMAAQHESRLLKKVYEDVYYPFLTKKEISNVLKGQDLYLMSEDLDKRIERAIKIREKEFNDNETS